MPASVRAAWDGLKRDFANKVTYLEADISLWPASIELINDILGPNDGLLCPNLRKIDMTLTPAAGDYEEDDEDDGEDEDDSEDKIEAASIAELDQWAQILQILATPALRAVSIGQSEAKDKTMKGCIRVLAKQAPHLHHLEVMTPSFSFEYGSAFKSLRSLTITGNIDHKGWRSLANCPDLREIRFFDGPDPEMGPSNPPAPREDYKITLPRLERLDIWDEAESHDPEFIVSIIRNTTMPLLLEASIDGTSEITKGGPTIRRALRRGSPLLRTMRINGDTTLLLGDDSGEGEKSEDGNDA